MALSSSTLGFASGMLAPITTSVSDAIYSQALLPQKDTLRLLVRWRVPIDVLMSLEPRQLQYYSFLHATQYILIGYGVTKCIFRWHPTLRLMEQRRSGGSGGGATNHSVKIVGSWRVATRMMMTYALKSMLHHAVARPVENALNLTRSLHWANIPAKLLRGVYYCGLKVFGGQRNPVATAVEIQTLLLNANDSLKACAKAALAASATFGDAVLCPAATSLFNMPRSMVAYSACEAYISRFVRILQPLGTLNAFRVCDTAVPARAAAVGGSTTPLDHIAAAQASLGPFGIDGATGKPRLSTRTMTRGSFERLAITTHDVGISIACYAVTEFLASFLQYGLIARVQHGKWEWQFERNFVIMMIRVILVTGITCPLLTRFVGPTTTVSNLFGLKSLPQIPTALISYLAFCVVEASLTMRVYNYYVQARCILSQVRQRLRLEAKYVAKCKKEGVAPTLTSPQVYTAHRKERLAHYFHALVGIDHYDLSEKELQGVRDFCAVHFLNGTDGFPFVCGVQYGLLHLCSCVMYIQSLEKNEPNPELNPRHTIALRRALRAGTLQRKNVSDLMAPVAVMPTQSSVAEFSPQGSPTSPGSNAAFPASPTANEQDADDCIICLRPLRRDLDDIVVGTTCGHTFHTQCLKECLNHSTICPLCRGDIAPPPENGFKVPAPRNPDELLFATDDEEEMPENPLEVLFNRSAANILARCKKQHQPQVGHWQHNYDMMLNYLRNKSCKGDNDAKDALAILLRLNTLYNKQLEDVIDRNTSKDISLYASVAKLVLEMLSCPQILYVEQAAEPVTFQ